MDKRIEIYADNLNKNYPSFRVPDFVKRSFPPELFHKTIDQLVEESRGLFEIKIAGQSFEQRPVRLLTVGNGKTSVLLWSQMHGDESTATMAIADILNYCNKTRDDEITRHLLSSVTLYFLPMLNPDGAERFQRRTAQDIDMNRDAMAQTTPEAKILVQLQQQLKPQFGFNLHDQELSTVGTGKELTAIAVLAPAFDKEKTFNDVRTRAKQLASLFASVAERSVAGKVAKYDDTFEPRAFGDNMQLWGTSTVLVESGHAFNDPEKDSIRKLNVVGLLSSFLAIADKSYAQDDKSVYDRLPFNGKRVYDIIIRNVRIEDENGKTTIADLGISYQVDTHSEQPARLVDLGDLSTFIALKEIDGRKKAIPRRNISLNKPFAWEKFF